MKLQSTKAAPDTQGHPTASPSALSSPMVHSHHGALRTRTHRTAAPRPGRVAKPTSEQRHIAVTPSGTGHDGMAPSDQQHIDMTPTGAGHMDVTHTRRSGTHHHSTFSTKTQFPGTLRTRTRGDDTTRTCIHCHDTFRTLHDALRARTAVRGVRDRQSRPLRPVRVTGRDKACDNHMWVCTVARAAVRVFLHNWQSRGL